MHVFLSSGTSVYIEQIPLSGSRGPKSVGWGYLHMQSQELPERPFRLDASSGLIFLHGPAGFTGLGFWGFRA